MAVSTLPPTSDIASSPTALLPLNIGRSERGASTVISAMQARGFNPEDDNEADALAILTWAIDTEGGVR